MSSTKWPTTNWPTLIDDPDAATAMFVAVRSVAERSFFAVAEPRDGSAFAALADTVPRWLVATVRFEHGPLAGALSCTLPETLAHALFDAFTGRDPAAPAPAPEAVHDLVGEFSNMVCGGWLTQIASRHAFTLSHPIVESAQAPGDAGGMRVLAAVDDLPVAVDLDLRSMRAVDPVLAPA
jgi:hypothetical protein